jgi:hypothetical protein
MTYILPCRRLFHPPDSNLLAGFPWVTLFAHFTQIGFGEWLMYVTVFLGLVIAWALRRLKGPPAGTEPVDLRL